ncbi:hypothetical protein PanWU01x14_335940 [Parasponia andersonii]|uniref:Uncharacterized protein n=1 Tax=Parasponia andersonii TaxID=3476 RepID=A0A2P5AG35_PARAD|nr:hypothetical protein PanWU01x14_335940 [Parasponia andersonii]
MLQHCFTLNPSASIGNSTDADDTQSATGSQAQASPPNVAREYSRAFQSDSYKEIRSSIQVHVLREREHEHEHEAEAPAPDPPSPDLDLNTLLQPNRDSVQEALRGAKPNTLTALVSDYFDHSENTSHLCLNLQRGVLRARALYAPLHDLLHLLPDDAESLSQSHCNWAFDVFLQFDALHNPFHSPDSQNFNHIRGCFSQLKQQLDRRLRHSRSAIRLLRRATASASTGFSVAVAFSAHALASLVAGPSCTNRLPRPRSRERRRVGRMAQLDAAAKGAYVLNNDLDTIDRLVARLHSAIEGDKLLVRLGLEGGRERHPIQEVVKQLRKNHINLVHQLSDVEEHICLCFNTVNRARALLFQHISLHQTL